MDWNPEFSRRARGFAVYAALRSLGRAGVAELVDRCCARARRFADCLRGVDGVEVLNDVVLDQVLVTFPGAGAGVGEGDAQAQPGNAEARVTARIVEAVQRSGECWMSGTTWQGRPAMRISVVNWQTTDDDVDRAVRAIEAALAQVG